MSEVFQGDRPQPEYIHLLIADDHAFFRIGLRQALEVAVDIKVVGEARNGAEAVDLAQRLAPDVVLMDIQMPGIDGVRASRLIFSENPSARVIVLTAHYNDDYVFEAIKAGAQGYLLKGISEQRLIESIRAVHRGEVLLDSQVAENVLREFRRLTTLEAQARLAESASPLRTSREDEKYNQLTSGEIDVLRRVAQGEDNQTIARQLNLSEKTVSNRLTSIYEKLQVNNRIQAALLALRSGWVDLNTP